MEPKAEALEQGSSVHESACEPVGPAFCVSFLPMADLLRCALWAQLPLLYRGVMHRRHMRSCLFLPFSFSGCWLRDSSLISFFYVRVLDMLDAVISFLSFLLILTQFPCVVLVITVCQEAPDL